MTANDLNQQTISFSGQSSKTLPFIAIDRLNAYFHQSNGAVVWSSDRYLGAAYSINGSSVGNFSFKHKNALPNGDIQRLF